MPTNNIIEVEKINLISIADSHSTSSSREIINENFKSVGKVIALIKTFPINLLSNMSFPKYPSDKFSYVIKWNGINYELIEANGVNAGKYIVRKGEKLYVPEDYQHIVVGNFINESDDVVIDGQLIIL